MKCVRVEGKDRGIIIIFVCGVKSYDCGACIQRETDDLNNIMNMKKSGFMAAVLMLLFVPAVFAALSFPASAQQAIFTAKGLRSPEVNPDGSVTFRIYAPDAGKVDVTGDFVADARGGWGTVAMAEDTAGVWSWTSAPLESELYSYAFVVDGMRMLDPSNVFQMRDVRSLMNIFTVPGERGDLYSVNDVPHGTVSKVWYHSDELGMDRRMTVYTPAGYEDSGRRRYPVLYLLHGMGGDEEAWPTLGRAVQILDNLIASGDAEPMIVVMPNGNVALPSAPGEGLGGFVQPTSSLPKTMDGTYEQTFNEIVSWTDAHYRTVRKSSGRAVAGLSMGGFHAFNISKEYPGTFDYVGLFSSAVWFLEDDRSPVYENMEEKLARQFSDGVSLYYISIGKDDFLYKENVALRAKLDELGYPYEYHESAGGHTWRNWRIYLSDFLCKIF